MMSDRDQRAETSRHNKMEEQKMDAKTSLKGKKFLNIKRLYTRRNWLFFRFSSEIKIR